MRYRFAGTLLFSLLLSVAAVDSGPAKAATVIVCPESVTFAPIQVSPGSVWSDSHSIPLIRTFKKAGVGSPSDIARVPDRQCWCWYGEGPRQGGYLLYDPPAGMTCGVNASNPRQFDCPPAPPPPKNKALTKMSR